MNNLTLLIGKGDTFWDISELVQKVTNAGKRATAPRSLDVVLYDSEMLSKRVPSDCSEGQTVVFYEGDKEIFQGLLMREDIKSSSRTLNLKAYDVCIRFTNNKDSFSYTSQTASQIFRDCCNRLDLAVGEVADTGHVIGELIKKATTHWDVIEDALSQTYKTTGERYYVYADQGKVNLIHRAEQTNMPVIELNTNIVSYDRTRSIEKTRTRLKIVTSEGESKNSTVLSELESKIGQFQEFESVSEQITDTEISQRVGAFKYEKGVIDQSLKIEALGDSSIKSGGCVFVEIPNVSLNRIMYVEEDTHVWEKGRHTMTIKLDYASTEAKKAAAPAPRNLKIGDTGSDVLELQKRLRTFGYYWDGALDGWFWTITDRAVRQFQRAYGIYVDGIVGPITRGKMGWV